MQRYKEYDNGLRLVVKKLPGMLSVSMGIFVGAGSADGDDSTSGISHFIEHMMFKGTPTRNAFKIADSIDSIGAQINAYTTKEMTCYHAKCAREHTEKTVEILSDIFFNSLFDEAESEKEKKVICEEIAMVEDSPEDLCVDFLAKAHYGDRYLGRSILGSAENVKGFTRAHILNYMDKYYVPSNVVVAMAGAISFDEASRLVDKYFTHNFKRNGAPIARNGARRPRPRQLYKFKDIEQVHMCLGFPSMRYDSRFSNEVALASIVLGGGMSSRLFQKIREEKGLAYAVYSYPSAYRSSGLFTIYAAVNPQSSKAVVQLIVREIKKLTKEGITQEEFERGKEQLKSSLIFGQESTTSVMNAYGKYMMFRGKVLNIEKKIKSINMMKLEDVNGTIRKIFDFDKLGTSYIGRQESYFDIRSLL